MFSKGIRWLSIGGVVLALMVGCKEKGGSKGESGAAGDSVQNADSALTVSMEGDTAAGASLSAMVPNAPLPTQGLRIAWVSMDTLLQGYDYYFAMEQEMESLTARAERDLTAQGKALETRMATFQDNVQKGLLTRSQAQAEQEALAMEQTKFLQLQESKRIQLQEEEAVRLRRVQNAIASFLNRYNAEKGYNYILSVGVIYGDPRLSVTQEVLDGLNKEYAEQHAKQQGSATSPK